MISALAAPSIGLQKERKSEQYHTDGKELLAAYPKLSGRAGRQSKQPQDTADTI